MDFSQGWQGSIDGSEKCSIFPKSSLFQHFDMMAILFLVSDKFKSVFLFHWIYWINHTKSFALVPAKQHIFLILISKNAMVFKPS